MIPAGLLPEGVDWFIAGGYAACPALATDVDIWVMSPDDAIAEHERLALHLRSVCPDESLLIDPAPNTDAGFHQQEEYLNSQTLKVAQLWKDGREFHILVTRQTLEEVLEGFDISTHQVALTSTGRVVTGKSWTPPHVRPVELISMPRTAARMAKICSRFGHTYKEMV